MVRFGTGESRRLFVFLSLISVYLVWGSTYLAVRFGLEGFPPFLLNGVRFGIAGALIYPLSRLSRAARPTPRQVWNAFRMGLFLLVGGVGGMTLALEAGIGSGVAATAAGVIPVWSAVAAGMFGEWPRRREWLGLALGLAGVIVLVQEGDFQTSVIGLILALAAPLSWSVGSVWGSHREMPDRLMSATIQLGGSGVVMLLIGLVLGERVVVVPDTTSILSLAYLAVFGSVIAYTAYVYLLDTVRPALATSYAYVNPVVAVALGLTLGGEVVTGPVLVALPLILVAVALVAADGKSRGRDRGAPEPRMVEDLADAGV